jgi:hypothetical protein
MNIFVFNTQPHETARELCDSHIVKMCLETAQILSTVAWRLDPVRAGREGLYKPTHTKHPCVVWAGERRRNFNWLAGYGASLCNEYTLRFHKNHAAERVINLASWYGGPLPNGGRTTFPAVVPSSLRPAQILDDQDVIDSYRRYYQHKEHIFRRPMRWTNRPRPLWLDELIPYAELIP